MFSLDYVILLISAEQYHTPSEHRGSEMTEGALHLFCVKGNCPDLRQEVQTLFSTCIKFVLTKNL